MEDVVTIEFGIAELAHTRLLTFICGVERERQSLTLDQCTEILTFELMTVQVIQAHVPGWALATLERGGRGSPGHCGWLRQASKDCGEVDKGIGNFDNSTARKNAVFEGLRWELVGVAMDGLIGGMKKKKEEESVGGEVGKGNDPHVICLGSGFPHMWTGTSPSMHVRVLSCQSTHQDPYLLPNKW
jgi:hypothetical protein